MERISVDLPEDLKQDFKVISVRQKRSMSEIVLELIESYVATKQSEMSV